MRELCLDSCCMPSWCGQGHLYIYMDIMKNNFIYYYYEGDMCRLINAMKSFLILL